MRLSRAFLVRARRETGVTREELQQLIRLGEGFTCEFKQSGTTHLGRELCAFANATGGVVLIGVTDDGQPVGVRDANRLKSEVQNVARSIEPPLVIDMDVVDNILIVNVPAQNSKPYSSGGKFYLRDGASLQQMSRGEIREFFFKEGVIHFDETPCERFSLEEDMTDAAWGTFRKRAKIPQDMNAVSALKNLHLLKDGRPMPAPGCWPQTYRNSTPAPMLPAPCFSARTKCASSTGRISPPTSTP